ncbi:MAG: permease [Campylobacterota bacterium]|nr:permease [Campylobacterota bacterium]
MEKKIEFKGVKFLYAVIIGYIILFFITGSHAFTSLEKSLGILYQLLPIFVFIIVLTTVINYFLKPKHIVKHLGDESGTKGIFYAVVSGIVSHGPMYAWYGLIEELREHGVKDSLLFIFFYARAIKIPMLPFMIGIFGLTFTIIMSFYIILFAVIQGLIYDKIK